MHLARAFLLLVLTISVSIAASCEKKKTSSHCTKDTCSGHGDCEEISGKAVCTCHEGYTGKNCSRCAPTHQDHDGDGVCLPSCETAGYDCNSHGVCDDASGWAACACDPGFVPVVERFCLSDGDGTACDSARLLDFSRTSIEDTTRGAGNAVLPNCVNSTGEDRIYTFVLTGTRRVRFQTSGFDTVLALRTACGDPMSELACDDDSGLQHGSRIEGELSAGVYYLVVDSFRESGDFTLEYAVECEPGLAYDPSTGDCMDDPCDPNPCTEDLRHVCVARFPDGFACACDPGAVEDPQNPDACIPNPNPTGESCVDPILLAPGEHAVSGATQNARHDMEGSCGGAGPDRVYTFTVSRPALFLASVEGIDAVLYLRSRCADETSELSCRDAVGTWQPETLSAQVPPGTYYFFVDTFDAPGNFQLTWRLHENPCTDEETVCPGAPVCTPSADWSDFACLCPDGQVPFDQDCVDDPCDPNPCTEPGRTRCTPVLPGAHACTCEIGYMEDNGACAPDPAAAEWAFLVYLNADNNLEEYGLDDIQEMAAVGSTNDVKILVLLDTDVENGGRARKLRIDPGAPVVVEDVGEVDMGDWRTLRDFGLWAVGVQPARHYALVLWDHGDGWEKKSRETGFAPAKSFSTDDHGSGDGISVSSGDFARALQAVTGAMGRKLDLVAFDACLMGMWEVAEAARPYARTLAASSETMPATGLPYTEILQGLAANPGWTGRDLAQRMVTAYWRGGADNAIYAASSLDDLNILTAAVNDFAAALLANPSFYAQAETARSQSQWYTYQEHVDLYDFASRVLSMSSAPAAVAQSAGALLQAFGQVVLLSRAQNDYPGAHGLSIYLVPRGTPLPAQYRDAGALWSQHTLWDEFLEDF